MGSSSSSRTPVTLLVLMVAEMPAGTPAAIKSDVEMSTSDKTVEKNVEYEGGDQEDSLEKSHEKKKELPAFFPSHGLTTAGRRHSCMFKGISGGWYNSLACSRHTAAHLLSGSPLIRCVLHIVVVNECFWGILGWLKALVQHDDITDIADSGSEEATPSPLCRGLKKQSRNGPQNA